MYRWAMLRVVIAESFQFDGRDYETRVTFDFSTRTYTARAYLAGQPANPFSHSLHEDTNYDFRQLHERTLVARATCALTCKSVSVKMEDFWEFLPTKPRVREFAQPLIDGMNAHLAEIDERIRRYAENYEFRRIAAVDRNVLRLAIYEMLFRDDIPPVVSINEAIELAKKFGGAESGRFVNGILDRVRKELTRPAREAVVKSSAE